MELVGRKVGNLRIEGVLGAGGMGQVFVAFDETLHRKVALKAILADRRLNESAKTRFLREARLLSQLDHPNICRIHDYISDDALEMDFLVLELIEGQTLESAVARGEIDPRRRAEIAERIAEVLVRAHAAGVVHRDLKPSNIMLTPDNQVKVLDFGLARTIEENRTKPPPPPQQPSVSAGQDDATIVATLTYGPDATVGPGTRAGAIIGTPGFMSPEQAHGDAVTAASDMYAFGLVLQTLYTGRMPFEPNSTGAALVEQARRGQTLPVTGLDVELTALIERLKSLIPTDRPTAIDTLARLRWIRGKPRRRLRRLAAAGVLALVAVAGAKYTIDLRRERAEAQRMRGEADELIGFMLGDLRAKLDPIGRLDVLDDVGDKALSYFESLSMESLTDGERFKIARTQGLLGEVRLAQNDLGAAESAFEESLDALQDLATRHPDNAEWQVALGAAHFWLGNLAYSKEDLDGAERHFSDYLTISEQVSSRDVTSNAWRQEVAYGHTNLAAVHQARGDSDAAIAAIRSAVEIGRDLVRREPANAEWHKGLAASISWLAETVQGTGDLTGALGHYEEELEIWSRLAGQHPDDVQLREMLSIGHNHVAELLMATGRDDEAMEHLRADLVISAALVEHDPSNSHWLRGLAMTQGHVGEILTRRGDLAAAEEHLRNSLDGMSALATGDSPSKAARHRIAQARVRLARLHDAAGRLDEALAESKRALGIERSLHAEDPDESETLHRLGDCLITRGRILDRLGRASDARAAWREALDLVESPARHLEKLGLLDVLARALLHLDRTVEAREVVRQLRNREYRSGAIDQLCRARAGCV